MVSDPRCSVCFSDLCSILYFGPFCAISPLSLVRCPCPLSLSVVLVPCPCPLSLSLVLVPCPCPLSLSLVPCPCPCPCPCPLSLSREHGERPERAANRAQLRTHAGVHPSCRRVPPVLSCEDRERPEGPRTWPSTGLVPVSTLAVDVSILL